MSEQISDLCEIINAANQKSIDECRQLVDRLKQSHQSDAPLPPEGRESLGYTWPSVKAIAESGSMTLEEVREFDSREFRYGEDDIRRHKETKEKLFKMTPIKVLEVNTEWKDGVVHHRYIVQADYHFDIAHLKIAANIKGEIFDVCSRSHYPFDAQQPPKAHMIVTFKERNNLGWLNHLQPQTPNPYIRLKHINIKLERIYGRSL